MKDTDKEYTPANQSTLGGRVQEHSTRLDSGKYNAGTKAKQQIHEECSSAMNHPVILRMLDEGRACDLSDAPKVDREPAFIIGSGPSLDDSIAYLKEWPYGIFCTTSHALTLMYHGVEPSHIIGLDPFSEWKEIAGVNWEGTRTKLITHPGVWPDLLEHWPNEVYLYRQNLGRNDSFYNGFQKRMYTRREGGRDATFHFLIKTQLTVFACSPPIQMFAADMLGYGRIYLAGVDFAYHHDKDRFTEYTIRTPEHTIESTTIGEKVVIPAEWEKHEHSFEPDPEKTYIETGNGLLSEDIHIYYKKNMLSAIRLSMQDVVTTDNGSITELPYADAEKVVSSGGTYPKPRVMSKKKLKSVAERYLASVGAFIIETSKGLSFVEAPYPVVDLYEYMRRMLRSYRCPNCNVEVTSNDNESHVGDECPHCKQAGLERAVEVDVEGNMKRIMRLLSDEDIERCRSVINEKVPVESRDQYLQFMKYVPGVVESP